MFQDFSMRIETAFDFIESEDKKFHIETINEAKVKETEV